MKSGLDVELDFTTDLSQLEFASKVVPLIGEAIEAMKQSLGVELEFDIFLVPGGREVHFILESV